MSNTSTNRWSLYLILGIPLLGVLLTTAYYFYIKAEGIHPATMNKGILITPPKSITKLELTGQNKPYQWDVQSGRWTFLVVGKRACGDTCKQQLYMTRQTRAALGKYMGRISHIYLDLDQTLTAEDKAWMAAEHPQLQVISAPAQQAENWFRAAEPALDILQPGRFYVVDPAAWVMMYYTPEHDYKQIISDMKFLLKNS